MSEKMFSVILRINYQELRSRLIYLSNDAYKNKYWRGKRLS